MTPFAGWGFMPEDTKPLMKHFKGAKLCRGTLEEPRQVVVTVADKKITIKREKILFAAIRKNIRSITKIAEKTGLPKSWVQRRLGVLAEKKVLCVINYGPYKHFYFPDENRPKGAPKRSSFIRNSEIRDAIYKVLDDNPGEYFSVRQLTEISGKDSSAIRKSTYSMTKAGDLEVTLVPNTIHNPSNPTVRAFRRKTNG